MRCARCASASARASRSPSRASDHRSSIVSPPVLQSLIAGRWLGSKPASALASAIDGRTVYHTHAESIDFGEAVEHARRVGVPSLLALDFQQRAQRLRALGKYLVERKELLYAIS